MKRNEGPRGQAISLKSLIWGRGFLKWGFRTLSPEFSPHDGAGVGRWCWGLSIVWLREQARPSVWVLSDPPPSQLASLGKKQQDGKQGCQRRNVTRQGTAKKGGSKSLLGETVKCQPHQEDFQTSTAELMFDSPENSQVLLRFSTNSSI